MSGIGIAPRLTWNVIVGAPMKRAFIGIAITCSLVGCGISQQQEIQMGQEYAQQINAQLPIVQDPELNRYINVLGDSIARLTSRGNLDWHFFIVDAQEVNAFAVPGGFVYVNRGLIQRADQMDELAGVLGHEIGHVVRRHTVKQMEKAQGANIGVTLACVLTSICNSQVAGAAINVAGGALFGRQRGVQERSESRHQSRGNGDDVSEIVGRAKEPPGRRGSVVPDAPAGGRPHHRHPDANQPAADRHSRSAGDGYAEFPRLQVAHPVIAALSASATGPVDCA